MSAQDGGAAFPATREMLGSWAEKGSPGMSLRDWFAGQALAGLVAQSSEAVLSATGEEAARLGELRTSTTFAREAYEYADAMLAARAAAGKEGKP